MEINNLANLGLSQGRLFTIVFIVVLTPILTTVFRMIVDGRRSKLASGQYTSMICKLDMLIAILYENNSNNVTLETARDIVDAQYSKSMYELWEEAMHFHYQNNVTDPARQKIIRERLYSKCRISYNRDILVLGKVKCMGVGLDEWMIGNKNPDDLALAIYNKLTGKAKMDDLTDYIFDTLSKDINSAQSYMAMAVNKGRR